MKFKSCITLIGKGVGVRLKDRPADSIIKYTCSSPSNGLKFVSWALLARSILKLLSSSISSSLMCFCIGSEVPAGPPRGSWARDAQPLLLRFPPGGEIFVLCPCSTLGSLSDLNLIWVLCPCFTWSHKFKWYPYYNVIISYLFGFIVVNLLCKNSHYYTVHEEQF